MDRYIVMYRYNTYSSINFTVVLQNYVTGTEDEYVILGNTAVIKCKIPSFVADFVSVESWTSSDGQEYRHFNDRYGRIVLSYIYIGMTIECCSALKLILQ